MGLGRESGPVSQVMPESPLLFPSVVPTCGFCLQVQSRSRGVKESRSWEVENNTRPHLSGRDLGTRRAIPGLPALSICPSGELSGRAVRHDSEKHKNNANEASTLLKTNDRPRHQLPLTLRYPRRGTPRTPPRMRRVGMVCLAVKPCLGCKKHTNEPGMSLKTKDDYGKPLVRVSR